MAAATPHYLLLSETDGERSEGHWRFVLKSSDGRREMIEADTEPEVQGERLELLSVVRGLEALETPSRVTLVTQSRYVRQGLLYGLAEWRENDWRWEWFGQLVPVKHRDLWQRIDRALQFHDVECRTWRFDPPHKPAAPHKTRRNAEPAGSREPWRRRLAALAEFWRTRLFAARPGRLSPSA